jgi:hypothetical protein
MTQDNGAGRELGSAWLKPQSQRFGLTRSGGSELLRVAASHLPGLAITELLPVLLPCLGSAGCNERDNAFGCGSRFHH